MVKPCLHWQTKLPKVFTHVVFGLQGLLPLTVSNSKHSLKSVRQTNRTEVSLLIGEHETMDEIFVCS